MNDEEKAEEKEIKMEVEVIEFYPAEIDKQKSILKGTLHVYLPEIHVDMRGIHVSKKKNYWWFSMPRKYSIDETTKERVHYPTFAFTDFDKNNLLIESIREAAITYIKNKNLC